jgi:hypothetical protein
LLGHRGVGNSLSDAFDGIFFNGGSPRGSSSSSIALVDDIFAADSSFSTNARMV